MHARNAILAMALLIACCDHEAKIKVSSMGTVTTMHPDRSMTHAYTWEVTMPTGAKHVGIGDVALVDSSGKTHVPPKRMGTSRQGEGPEVVTVTFELGGAVEPAQLRIGDYVHDVGTRAGRQ